MTCIEFEIFLDVLYGRAMIVRLAFYGQQSSDIFIRAAFPSTPSVSVAQMDPAGMCSCTAKLQPVAPNETTTEPRGEK